MSGIVLSASVRQNLLSLQSTANLLSTTQNRLATGKKVNTALDNPTNFFTAQSLDSRAGDISNLLDGIGNGVQVLQAANTGITSLQKLVDTAKSIANQALQTSVGYSQKSNVSTTIAGATADDLRGTTSFSNAIATGNPIIDDAGAAAAGVDLISGTAGSFTGAVVNNLAASPISASTLIYGASGDVLTTQANTAFKDGDVFNVDGTTITVKAGSPPAAASLTDGSSVGGNVLYGPGAGASGTGQPETVYLNSTTSVQDFLDAFNVASGLEPFSASNGTATLSGGGGLDATVNGSGQIVLNSSNSADLALSGKADALKALGLTGSTGSGTASVAVSVIQTITTPASLANFFRGDSKLTVDGKTITFKGSGDAIIGGAVVPAGDGVNGNIVTDGKGNSTVYTDSATISDVLNAIDLATGVQTASISGATATLATAAGQTNSTISAAGALQISTGTAQDLSIIGTGDSLSLLGLTGNTGTAKTFTAGRTATAGGISGKTLSFSSFNAGAAVNVTFGDGTGGTVKTLDQLNTALQANNLSATLDSTGKLTISAINDYASSTLGSLASGGAIGGTVTSALTFSTASAPVVDTASQTIRSNYLTQYNDILAQITSTAQDASFNGVNLLGGDTLKLTFNETGKSTLGITGVAFDAAGLGLANLKNGVDFIDNTATNKVITDLGAASTLLRSQASALGSNLSIVQIRQDFSNNLINVLQTGSSNLTLADTNEEAANSQALSTRQSIAVSALSLANQSQQSVLQLLR